MRKFPKLPAVARQLVTSPKTPEHESVIPDEAAYRKFTVAAGDDESEVIVKYRRAQVDTLQWLTGMPVAELVAAARDPRVQRLVHEHNKKMKLTDMTA